MEARNWKYFLKPKAKNSQLPASGDIFFSDSHLTCIYGKLYVFIPLHLNINNIFSLNVILRKRKPTAAKRQYPLKF